MQTDELRDYLNGNWQALRKNILEGTYKVQAVRKVEIPKPQAQTNLNEGCEWVIELDLEKFFDKVNHDKLMGLLAKKITDKGTLKLIRSYLTRVVSWKRA